jgi:hypothetical protein
MASPAQSAVNDNLPRFRQKLVEHLLQQNRIVPRGGKKWESHDGSIGKLPFTGYAPTPVKPGMSSPVLRNEKFPLALDQIQGDNPPRSDFVREAIPAEPGIHSPPLARGPLP